MGILCLHYCFGYVLFAYVCSSVISFHFHMCGFEIHQGIGYEVVTGYLTIKFTVNGLRTEFAKCRRHWYDRYRDGYIVRSFATKLLGLRTNILHWMHSISICHISCFVDFSTLGNCNFACIE